MISFETIKSKRDFDLLYQRGVSLNGKFFYLKCLKAKGSGLATRFGIVISTKISKSAVVRNLKRRQLKEIIRLNRDKIKDGMMILLVAKEDIVKAEYDSLEKEFLSLIKKI